MSLFEWLGSISLWVYAALMVLLAAHAVHLFWMLGRFLKHRKAAQALELAEAEQSLPPDDELPAVLVQLPVFNERDVVARAVETIGNLDWPKDKLFIQLLDDSTDDSVLIGQEAIAKLTAQGLQAESLHRVDRVGFKAGALQAGMAVNDAPFIAIFDADFVPTPDFLRRAMLPLLQDEGLCLVQGRWEHLNREQNALTRAQAIGIDGHFAIEQSARAWSGLAMNFNGTCGVWRRAAIEDAGGWEHDTLTEDMDLSYRAQLKGWRCTFRCGLAVPGELPETIEALRSQQFRWAKGSIQTAKKLLPAIWRSKWDWHRKIAATMHMTHYMVHPLLFAAMILAPFVITLNQRFDGPLMWLLITCFIIGTGAPVATYIAAEFALGFKKKWSLLWQVPRLAALGTGIAITNAQAVWQAIRGTVSPFVRTPKGGKAGSYNKCGRSGIFEMAMGAWASIGIFTAFNHETPWITPLLLVYATGFTWIGLMYFRGWLSANWYAWREEKPQWQGSLSAWLFPLAVLSIGGYVFITWLPGSWRDQPLTFGLTALALGAVWPLTAFAVKRRSGGRGALALILIVALAMRLVSLGLAPSDDVNRYILEGRQIAAWQNPYAVAPSNPVAQELGYAAGMTTTQFAELNHPDWTASYPPLALTFHTIVTEFSTSARTMQIAVLIAEFAAVFVGLALLGSLGLPKQLIVLHAWNPLIILFTAGEAHHDGVMVLFLLGGLLLAWQGAQRRGLLMLCAAALIKPFAVWALLPQLWRGSWRRWAACFAVAALAYLPFAGAGAGLFESFGRFGTTLSFNGALEPLVRMLVETVVPEQSVRLVTVAILVSLLIGISFVMVRNAHKTSTLHNPALTAQLLALLLLCLPTIHAWYLILIVVLLPVVAHSWGLMLWCALAPGYWLHGVLMQANNVVWAEDPWVRTAIHLPAILLLGWEISGRPGLPTGKNEPASPPLLRSAS